MQPWQLCWNNPKEIHSGIQVQSRTGNKIKYDWRQLTEINSSLPYFPPDKAIGNPCVAQTVLQDHELEDIFDSNLPKEFKDICKRNQYNVLGHPISNALNYLQNVKSTYSTTKRSSSNSSSGGGSSKKGKVNDKGKGNRKSKVGKYSHCSKWHFTKEGDFSDCRSSLSGEKYMYNSSSNSDNNKRSKYKEFSFRLQELTTLMKGTKSKKQKLKVWDWLLLAANFLNHSSDWSSLSEESYSSSSEHRRSWRKKLKKFTRKRNEYRYLLLQKHYKNKRKEQLKIWMLLKSILALQLTQESVATC